MTDGGWNIADCVERAYDVEGMDVGVIAAGRIGLATLQVVANWTTDFAAERGAASGWKRN